MLPSGEMSLCPFRERGNMTIKHIEELWCDRCKRKFEQREPNSFTDTMTMVIGWFKFRNGSGSKTTVHGRRWENLDYDLCSDCTQEFTEWWKNPPERVSDAGSS